MMWLSTKVSAYTQDQTFDRFRGLEMSAHCFESDISTLTQLGRDPTSFSSKELPSPNERLWHGTRYIMCSFSLYKYKFTKPLGFKM